MVSYSSGKAGLEEQEDSPIGELTYLDRLLPMMWASSGKNWSVFRNLVDVEIRPQVHQYGYC